MAAKANVTFNVADKDTKSLRDRFFAVKQNPFGPKSNYAVTRSADFRRIAEIPRREHWKDLSEALTLALALPPLPPGSCPAGCPCKGTGYMKLRPRQAWALAELYEQGGGLAILGVGEGKTLITFLLVVLMEWERPVMLVPAGLRNKALKIDIPHLSRHWRMPPLSGPGSLEIRSYEELSQASFSDYLSKRRIPDGIVADEVQALKNRGSARTKRLLRFFGEFPFTQFAGFSGSIVHRSLMDYGHIANLALKDTSPVPHSFIELKTWADTIDDGVPDFARPDPGALWDFCRTGETVRDGYRRRLLENPGIISSPGVSTNVGLIVQERAMPKIPAKVVEAFHVLRNTADLPGGEKATTILDQTRHARELLHGFYLKWVWPGGIIDKEWLKKRKAWRKYVRKMTTRTHEGMWLDTEFQVAQAVKNGVIVCSEYEWDAAEKKILRENVNVYAEWKEIREDRKAKWGGKPEPPKEIEWLSDFMVLEVEKWAREHTGDESGIIWIENIKFMDELRKRGNVCFGAGENDIELETGQRSVFASYAHTTGKNLQMFHRMYFPNPLTSGKAWEQGLGREHRPGQLADDVIAEVTLGCRETWWSFDKSKRDANYIESTMGQQQRLNKATMLIETTDDVAVKLWGDGDPLWAETGHSKIDGMFGKVGPDGKRAATATPVLTAMRLAAKVPIDQSDAAEDEDIENEETEA